MNAADQEKIEVIKAKYRELSAVPKLPGFIDFAQKIRAAGNLVGRLGVFFLGVVFLVVGINFMREPVNYLISGEKVSATVIRYEETFNHNRYSLLRVPIVSLYSNGQRRTAVMKSRYVKNRNDLYINKRLYVRYLSDFPAFVIPARLPVRSLSIYSIFMIFGAVLIYITVRYGNDNEKGTTALPRDDYTKPIDDAMRDMSPEQVLIFILEPSRTTRVVLLTIALALLTVSILVVNSSPERETGMLWKYLASGFHGLLAIAIILPAARRQKTTVNLLTDRVEQQKGFIGYNRKRSWPIAHFRSVMVDSRTDYSRDFRKHTKYYLKLVGTSGPAVLVDAYIDGITAAFNAKKLSMFTGLPADLGQQ